MLPEAGAPAQPRYHLRLFVAGASPRSLQTIHRFRRFCEHHLADRVDAEVVDIYQQPHLAEQNQVVAAPTLVRLLPLPLRRVIGDLSNEAAILRGLGLLPEPDQE